MTAFDYWDIATGEGLTNHELHERFDAWLDEAWPEVAIAGYGYSVSNALKSVDPIAYRVDFNDWLDSELGETLTDEEPKA